MNELDKLELDGNHKRAFLCRDADTSGHAMATIELGTFTLPNGEYDPEGRARWLAKGDF
jgi:hypothetical protein